MSQPIKQVTLSVSSQKTLNTCQQKYVHKKVLLTPEDPKEEDADEALNFGKAFHKVLEETLHTSYNDKLIMAAMMEHGVPAYSRPLLTAMLDNYTKLHKASGLKVIKCEFKLEIPSLYIGYIDFIAQDSHGWWIGDNKTAARHDPQIAARLHKDPQINMYSHFADEIARALDLKGPFLGFRYRQSIKSKAGTPAGLSKGTPTYDIIIEASALDPKGTWEEFLASHNSALELHNGITPKKNFNACFEYFRPCEFFSSCYGCLPDEGHPLVTIHTLESLESADLLA